LGPVIGGFGNALFRGVHGHGLIYNACWEDPLLDRAALKLRPNDTVLAITSGGCNVLDYALTGPARVYAVDVNPRQNALLELKLAGIERLDFDTFFSVFGEGRLAGFPEVYRAELRPLLSEGARGYWDGRAHWFSGSGWWNSFYFRGSAGFFARLINFYIDRVAKVRDAVMALLRSRSVAEQREIYENELRHGFWGRMVRWLLDQDGALALLGVPRPQREQIERTYAGGIVQFVEDRVEAVFARLPIADNYFWKVYLTGGYTRGCCPEYLKPENFARLKAGLAGRISVHTAPVLGFLEEKEREISRYVLLDHMDWLGAHHRPVLARQWQAILDRATPDARAIWRSGGLRVDYVDPIPVTVNGRRRRVGEVLGYHPELAARLHEKDRVHTYGSFYIADLHPA
jgi:S-adenosylmethionine-diacylglycerol 3-amino-3-carboxypropyl transferase